MVTKCSSFLSDDTDYLFQLLWKSTFRGRESSAVRGGRWEAIDRHKPAYVAPPARPLNFTSVLSYMYPEPSHCDLPHPARHPAVCSTQRPPTRLLPALRAGGITYGTWYLSAPVQVGPLYLGSNRVLTHPSRATASGINAARAPSFCARPARRAHPAFALTMRGNDR